MKLNNKEAEKQAQRNKEGEENTSALSSKEKITRLASTRVKRPGSQSISEIKTRDRVNPYESEALNWKYKQTVAALYNIQQKSGYKGNLFDDAKEATDYYAQTVYDSHRLFGGNRGKDYLSIAEKSFQEKLQDLVYKYQYGAQTGEQLRQSLLDTEYQGPKQIAAQNQQNVIDRAAQMGAGKLPDEQQRLIDSFSRLPEIAGKASMYGGLSLNPDEAATWQYAMRQPGNEWMAEANWDDPLTQERMRKWAAEEAQKIRGGYVLDYDTADKYMEGVPGYVFAREHAGDLTPYMDAAQNAGALLEKAAKQGWGALTAQEQEALWQAAQRDEGGLDALALSEMDQRMLQRALEDAQSRGVDLNALGGQWAGELDNVNGIFTTYTPSREQQAILDLYRQTPEGARDYLDEATGTKEEQKAKDNFFFVTERDKFNAYEQREDFNPNTPINEKFMNDPVYAAVSGRPSSSLLGTLGQTTFQAFTDVNYMTPEEKGKYRWYYENVNPKTAQEYYHLLSYELAERREGLQEAGTKATVKSDPGNALAMEAFSFLENIPGGIFGTVDLYGQMLKQATGELTGPVNYHSPWQGLNNQAETIRTETTAEIQEAMRNAGASDWLIQTVTMLKNGFEGAGDSLLSAYVGGFFGGTETGAKLLTNLIVSSRSALESMQSIHDRNGSDEQAAIGGIASGVAEWFFEQFSIEQLFSDAKRIGKQGFSDWVKSMLKEMGVNAQQEGFTSIADSIADVLIMGDESEYALSRDEYERLDMSPEEAEARAKQDLAEKAGQEALGGLIMGGIVGAGANVSSAINTAAEDRATGEQIISKGWGQELASAAEETGIKGKAAQKLSALNKENAHAGKFARAAGEVYRDWVSRQSGNTQESREALDAAKDMLTHKLGDVAKTGTDAQNAVDAGKKLARSARISEDGQTRLQPKEGEETGKAVELVGLDVAKDVIKVKIREDGEVKSVPFEEVSFPDAETADKAAVAAMAGGEKLGNALFNAKEPDTGVSFADYAKDFVRAYDAAQTGLSIGGMKAAGIGKNLTDGEIKTAHELGQRDKYTGDLMAELRDRAKAYLREKISPTVKEADVEAVADALLAQAEGEELTEEQAEALGQYEDNVDVQQAAEALEEAKTPEFGAANAYQLGLSGRRFEEVESTLQELGYEMTDEIRAEFERGQSDLAERETKRINDVKALNAGEDGTRVGVLRSISPKEAEAAGVGIVSAEYFKQARDAVTALRGLAEATGVNMVMFESPVKEGTHVGDNGWYDPKTRTVYLDIYAGKENERALLRTAAHELTHFIQDWSPANYKKLRDFLLDYYYQTKDTVKKLVQEQMDKDKTLTEAEAMDEVIADASEMMLDGDKDAAAALGEQHPRLFTRIKGWIDTWAKALTRAWRSILPSNAASKLLKASAEHFQAAQKVWWEALEEASVNNRGEIRRAEIDEERMARIREIRERLRKAAEDTEKRRQEAIARADAATTAEEGRQAVEDAQAAQALKTAQEAQAKEEEKKVNQEAKQKQAEADVISARGRMIEKRLGKLSQKAAEYVRGFAEAVGIALDGSQETGAGFVKEALHYYNQGKSGIAFTPNTEMGKGEAPFGTGDIAFARKMNEFGYLEYTYEKLGKMAKEPDTVPEAEQNAQVTAENSQPITENAQPITENEQLIAENAQEAEEQEAEQTTEEETVAALEAMAEGEQRAEATKEEPEEEFLNFDPSKVREKLAEYKALEAQGINPLQDLEDQAMAQYQAMEEKMADEGPTSEESTALENHTQTVQKMADVLKGMTKKARALVMKWAANEQINLKMEDGSERAIQFAQFAKKWYDAGRDGLPRASLVEPTLRNLDGTPATRTGVREDEADAEWPPFLQDDFYNQGKADAEAEAKKQKKKEAKKNEKPVDKGTREPAREPGTGTERLLEEVPAEVLQEQGGGRDTVRQPEVQERRDGAADAGPDGTGTVRERGEGVYQRDDVRPEAGEVTEESETEETPEEQLQEAVEDTDTRLEAETPKGTNYQIGESLGLHRSTEAKAQYKDNVAAIRLLRQLEAENRYATKEEQDVLSKYVGWGGLANVFSETDPKWKKEYAELAELLTPDEYEAARGSTPTAFYTGIDVIRAMYAGLDHLGFQGGRMLEPSGGIGHFLGAMPADMQQKVRSWTMVELDSITGRIAAKLYPNADVRVQGFEKTKIGNNVMDVAIGNVPFDVTIYDPEYKDKSLAKSHNYFFVKAIDKVRPGGIVMFLTSSGTMDAYAAGAREYMAQKADLIGAVRLPNTTFKENAGTEVVADILIFKKREDGTPYRGESFRNSTYFNVNGDYTQINEYFAKHPEMILGTPTMVTTQHGRKMTIVPKGKNLGQQITEAIGRIEAKMDYSKAAPSVEELQKRAEKARANTKENGFEVKDGKIYQNQNGELKVVEMKEADAQKVKDMLEIRDTARALQELQKQGADKKAIADKRKELNKQYDAFTQKNGVLHNPKNAKLIEADPDHFFILALENYDKKAKIATKADIFSKDTIAAVVTVDHADTPQDAIAVVLNEKGYIDLARAAELLGVTEDEAKAAMIDSGLAFLNDKGTLETRENYLSGDVRAKLRQAEALATVDDRYQRNVDELRKVIPEDVTRENIYVKPGATWIPESVYEQFICDTLKEFNTSWRRNVTVKYIPASGEYTLELSNSAKRDYRNTQEWGTNRKTFAELLDALMNNRTINVYNRTEDGKSLLDEAATLAAREKAEKIQQRFREWLWENEDRAKALEKLYNDKYNAIVVPEYDGSGLTIAGANADKQLRPHQKNVVHRIIQNGGNTLIAHCVGAGKTAEMAGAAMKLRQLGIVQKPVFVVPKALVGQWGREFLDFFPAAKILVLSENDFNAKNRKEFSNRIATGDYDAIIMSREQFGKLPMTEEYQKQFYQETINQITQAMDDEKRKGGGKGMSVKNMEKAKKRLEAKLKSLETKKKDVDNINFEDMGIDSIFVDEAHEYKNLMFTSNMNNISGLGNKEGSQRAFDMYMKTKYLRSINGGRGIVFATATPVMNSMSEMYIMQKYLQEDKLNQLGITSFDAWANLFGEVMTVIEPTPSGKGFRQKEAFARFKNLPELQRLFRSFADVMQMQGLQDIMRRNGQEIKIPKMKGGKRITIECEPGAFQLQYIDQLAERAEKLRHGNVDPKVDNMLKITSEGRKLSYTQRMIDPSLPYEEGSKILKCVENVERIYKESKANKGTQLIFCDMATPKGSATIDTEGPQDMTEDAESVDFYGDIKRMLTAKGIPANEIAFIHDADTNEKRNKLFEDVNEGRVRVLIGSTGKMGVGMNAQKRVVALHHLDAPWRPGDIEQREGRAIRQKNMNDEVGIYVYVTKKTFDTRMWDNLYRKANFINQIMNGTNTAREVEGDGDFALSAAEIKAIATGDPMIVEQFEVNNQIKKLESLEREWQKDKKRAREQIQLNAARIGAYEANLPKAEADMKTAAALDLEKNFLMKIDGKRYTERAKANAPLLEAVKKHEGIVSEKKIGEIGGFTLYADGKGSIVIKGAGTYSVNVNFDSDTGTMTRVLNQIKGIQENADRMKAAIEQLREENRSAEERMNQPFDKAEELEKLRARAEEIANILNPVEDQAGADNVGEETEEETPDNKIKYSRRAETITTNGIKEGMDDGERYGKLIGANVTMDDATGMIPDADIEQYSKMGLSELTKTLLPIARQYGLIGNKKTTGVSMQNKYLSVQANFSKRSLKESVNKQGSSLMNLAKLLPVFKKTYENAVPILVHGDRYQYAVNDKSNLDSFVYLLGAFQYAGKTIPVQFELKHMNDQDNSIYVVATIKEDTGLATSGARGGNVAPTSSTVSIADIIKEVKKEDTRILANLPNPFLNEEQKAGKREGLKAKGTYIRGKAQEAGKDVNAPITMTTERIDAEIHNNGAKFSPDYSQAYMAYVDPADFLALNAMNPENKQNESRVLVAGELREEKQTPFMTFDQETGRITGHEGRHRMAALAYAGVKQVAILLKPDGSEGRYNRTIIDELKVKGKGGSTATIYNLIPVNEKHRQELIDIYGESPNWFKYSTRDPDEVSDRQLLARAYEGLAKTDYERKALERYKGLIDQLDTDTEELRKIKRQIHDKLFIKGQVDRLGAQKLREQANALEKKIASTDKILLNMQRSAALKNVLEIEKKAAAQKVAEKVRGQLERYNAGVEKREYENRIKKTTERLAKWIVQPDKTNHVPKALKESVARFLVSISQGTGTEFKSRKREFNFLETMRELQGIVSDITDYQMQSAEDRVQADFGMYIDLPDGFKEQMAALVNGVETKMRDAGGVLRVDDMTNEQLKTLYQVLTTISTSITQANDLLALNTFRHVSQAAQNSIMFIRDQGKVEYLRGGEVHNFLNWENMQPIRAFERFGEGGEAIFRALMRGQAQMAQNVKEILSYTDKQYAKEAGRDVVYTAQEVKEWSQQIKTFDVNGKKVVMPVADVMSMYCLMKRAQAVGHILGEGFRVADFKDKRGKLISGSGVTITEEEARIITNSLTNRQKQVADELQKIMSTTGSRWGNYVSMKRFGYEMFTENSYFPIEVDSDRLTAKTDESKGNELYRLLNISSVKPITRGARNRLMIKNIFDVFSSHMTDMAQYNALGLPVLDAVKWINYREGTTLPDGTVVNEGVRGAAREMYGNKAARYIIELLKDVNGTQATGDVGEQFSRKMLMRYNRQAVAANLSVAMKQPLSIIRASMELGGLDLLRGAVGNQGLYTRNRDEMLKYSGIALWKDLGFYDVNVSRPVKNMIMHSDTAVDRLMENATKLAESADRVTWAAIWGASKAWVQKQGKTYESTQQFMEAVAEKFEEVIYKTQVVDSILTRSQFMRGTSFMSKWLSSFMSEPTTTYNMLLEAWWRMRNDLRRGKSLGQAFATHGRLILRTTAVYMASAAVMTVLEALIGAWRDDDDYETFMEKFEAGLLNYAIDEFNPLNLLPVVQDFMDFGKKLVGDYVLPDEWNVYSYAGGSSPVYSALDTFVSAANVADKYFSGDKGYTLYGVVYKTASALSQAAGVPVAPAMREVVSLWNNTVVPFAPEMRIESYESTDKQGAAALYKAITAGDNNREALVRRQLAANNVEDKSLESALKSLVKADREAGKITEEQAAQYLTEMGKMSKNDAYFKVKEWDYEANSDDQYGRFDRLEQAVISGTGIEAAMKELTTHGYSQKDVETKVRSIISKLTGKQKTMTATKAESLLKTYGGMDADQAWIRAQELTYQARTGQETTADIAMVAYAIEQHTSPKAAIDGLLAHGKEKKDISTAVTNKYKQQYLELRKTNVGAAATLKGQLITIFDYLGYDGKKKVEEWEKEKKK